MFQRHTILAAIIAMMACARGASFGVTGFNAQPYTINIPTHITSVNQSVNASTNIIVEHDTPCTLAISAPGGTETFANGAATLATRYRLTGAALLNPDAGWITAATFLTRIYNIAGGGIDTLSLEVKADAPVGQAPDAGVYSASVTLTLTW